MGWGNQCLWRTRSLILEVDVRQHFGGCDCASMPETKNKSKQEIGAREWDVSRKTRRKKCKEYWATETQDITHTGIQQMLNPRHCRIWALRTRHNSSLAILKESCWACPSMHASSTLKKGDTCEREPYRIIFPAFDRWEKFPWSNTWVRESPCYRNSIHHLVLGFFVNRGILFLLVCGSTISYEFYVGPKSVMLASGSHVSYKFLYNTFSRERDTLEKVRVLWEFKILGVYYPFIVKMDVLSITYSFLFIVDANKSCARKIGTPSMIMIMSQDR